MKRIYFRLMSLMVLVSTIFPFIFSIPSVSASPGYLDPITIRDSDPFGIYTINVTLDGIAQYQGKYDASIVGYCIFRAFKVAIAEVWDGAPPLRDDIIVNTTNPTSGSDQAIDFLTKARARRKLTLTIIPGTTGIDDSCCPSSSSIPDTWIWVFISNSTRKAIEIKVKEEVFPVVNGKTNQELRAIVLGKLKSGETPTEEEMADYEASQQEFMMRFETWSDTDLFETRTFYWEEPSFDPEAFMYYYSPELKSEWGRLLTAESAYESVIATNLELQDLNNGLSIQNENLEIQLSETEMHRYLLFGTTLVFAIITIYLVMRK